MMSRMILITGLLLLSISVSAEEAVTQTVTAEDIFNTRCTICHQRPEPDMLSPMQWKMILNLMQIRMKQAGMPQLNEKEFEMVQTYLMQKAEQ